MITLIAGQSKMIQAQFSDALNNPIPIPANADVMFTITGPATLSDDPGETQRSPETSRKILMAPGAVGSGTITAVYNPGAVTVNEPYIVNAGPITKGQIVVL